MAHRHRTALQLVAAASVAVALAGACGTTGRDLAEVPPGVTAPPRSTTTTVAASVAPAALTLTTDAWTPGGIAPVASSCDGEGTSPSLQWVAVPAGTAELALVVTDPDAGGFVHWIVTGLAPNDGGTPAGSVPPGATEHESSGGEVGWFPLCPPPGDLHTYTFQLLALPAPAQVPLDGGPADVVAALEGQATTRAVLTGTLER